MQRLKWTIRGAVLLLSFCVTLQAQPQGGFGGFGGGGGGGGNQARNQMQTYNPSGAVGNATISVDPDSQNVTIIADEETTRYIEEVIRNLDRPQPQVLIKVVFMEVTHNNSLDLGIEGGYGRNVGSTSNPLEVAAANAFGLSGISSVAGSNAPAVNRFGQPVQSFQPNPPGAGVYQILGSDFQATLRAIATAGKAELLSRPSVLARNNQPATIVVGQSVPLITNVRYDTFGNAINSVTYQNVGIILRVTPFITTEGMVQMIVQPQTSSIDPTVSIPISAGVNAPVIAVRSADTVVVTPDGQTVVIGGLMQNSKSDGTSKVPFLGDIPLLGNLFKRKSASGTKTELLIFLTPHVIHAPSQLAGLSEQERGHMLPPKSYSEEELDRFLEKIPVKSPENGVPGKRR